MVTKTVQFVKCSADRDDNKDVHIVKICVISRGLSSLPY